MPQRDQSHQALTKILELAQSALDPADEDGDGGEPVITCTPKVLPSRLQESAAELARTFNPANAPLLAASAGLFGDRPLDPLQITMFTAKYWGPSPRRLTVSFMDSPSAALRSRILSHMNAWSARIGISFSYTQGVGQVRISLGPGGYWSYLGTDVLLIPQSRPTMNLQGFSLNTSESEYRRVVRHETGHTLGCPHEHMRQSLVDRIDRNKAYAYFLQTQGWNSTTVDQQVLTPLNEASVMGTPADQTSIMCYQLPGAITKDGRPITGGLDINATDFAYMAKLYPRPRSGSQRFASDRNGDAGTDSSADAAAAPTQPAAPSAIDDWDPSEDVRLEDIEVPA